MGTNYTRAFTPGIDKELFPGLIAVRTSSGWHYLSRNNALAPDPGGHLSNLRPSVLPEVLFVPGWAPFDQDAVAP